MPISKENLARYPDDWALRSYFVRKVRARDRCEWCGVPNGYSVGRLPRDHRIWFADRFAGDPIIVSDGWFEQTTEAERAAIIAGPSVVIVLTCAHVHDMRPEAASLLNLAALCQLCHNRHDAPFRRANRQARARVASGQHQLFE